MDCIKAAAGHVTACEHLAAAARPPHPPTTPSTHTPPPTCTISMCNRPRKPQRKPKPMALLTSGSNLSAASFSCSFSSASRRSCVVVTIVVVVVVVGG